MGIGKVIDLNQFVLKVEKAVANGVATLDSSIKIPKNQIDLSASDVGAIAISDSNTILSSLNAASGTISSSILPSYVDDILNYATLTNFPVTGETSKIYVAEDTNKIYRWSSLNYIEISSVATTDTAMKLSTPRTISTTGDASYSVSFDGSSNVTSELTLATVNSSTGSFGSATQSPAFIVNSKGLITEVTNTTITPLWSSIASKPTTLSGFGIIDAQPLGNELTALQALADNTGFLRKTGNGGYEIDTNSYLPLSGGTISLSLKIDSKSSYNNIFEIGSTGGFASTPSIDFHSGLLPCEYDCRISASGGSGILSRGTLIYRALNHNFFGTINTYTLYSNSIQVSGPFQSTSSTTGALLVSAGGLGVFGDTNIGGSLTAALGLIPNTQVVSSAATVTPVAGNDVVIITAQAVNLTLANPTGTWARGKSLIIRIKDNGTARTISYETKYRAIGVVLPTTTTANKSIYLGCIYDLTDDLFDIIGVTQE